jgi:hypothetical protein
MSSNDCSGPPQRRARKKPAKRQGNTDLRVRRTRERLGAALIGLIEEKAIIPLAADGGSDPDTDHGLSLSSGNQQVEQDRAPLFSFISLNWRGQPLINYETIINRIGSTRTRSGLKVKAVWTRISMRPGIKVSDEQLGEIQLRCHKVHPAWNYTILSRGRT